ncbi:MAG: enoyl-CoA hydratase-related protein [Rhizobiaceae bacterium]
MSQTNVIARVEGFIGHLTFSNPARLNALPQDGWLSVKPELDNLLAENARVIIVSGEGDNFCAGADISEFDTVRKDAKTARTYEASNVQAFDALRTCPVPTIAKIRGFCLGGGFGLAAACDLRVATQDARFAIPAAKLGLGYPIDAIADIVDAVGRQNAKHLLFTAETLSGTEMLDMGFLLEVLDESRIDASCIQLSKMISQLAPLTHRATKAAIAALRTQDWDNAKQQSDLTFSSHDYDEGRKAFREKRPPRFTAS